MSPDAKPGRLLVDVSTLTLWSGTPTGITSVERALALAALRRPNTDLAVFDRETGTFRALNPTWRDTVLGWTGMIETPLPPRQGWRRLVPGRKRLVDALERRRLTSESPRLRATIDAAQRAILALRPHDSPIRDAAGRRIDRIPRDLALGPDLAPGPGDTIFIPSAGWVTLDLPAIAAAKTRTGFRYATLCYDLMQITHPQFWHEADVTRARTYWRDTLALADQVIVNAHCIAEDVAHYATACGLPPPPTRILPLGYDPPPPAPPGGLPPGLEPDRYILFVSTIEPRKGHATLLDAWRRLMQQGVIQRTAFKLVFVGRPGWMVDSVMQVLASPEWAGTVIHLQGIPSETLNALYRGAAFCVYPSRYEGFGLPLIESFARGAPVIASTGGALPETAAGLAPCLDPLDTEAWAQTMQQWIEDKLLRRSWALTLRKAFRHPDWTEAATAILDAAAVAARYPASRSGMATTN